MCEKKSNNLVNIFKVLGEEIRLRLLNVLNNHELMVGEIQETLSLKQSNLSSHLNLLKKYKLVSSRREGQKIFYKLITNQDLFVDELFKKIISNLKSFPWYKSDIATIEKVLLKRKKTSVSFFNKKNHKDIAPGQLPDALLLGFIQLVKNKMILDMGCGEGNLSVILAEAGNQVYGIDNSKKQIELANKKNLINYSQCRTHYSCQDMEKTKFNNQFFDIVCICHSLHHTGHPFNALQESYRLLKNQGILMIFDLDQHKSQQMEKEYGDFWMGFESQTLKTWLLEIGYKITTYKVLSESYYPIKKKNPQQVSPLIVVADK